MVTIQEWHKSKTSAIKALKAVGYAEFDKGESGDHGYGSRIYLKKETSQMNELNWPKTEHATVSKVGRMGWAISVFKDETIKLVA